MVEFKVEFTHNQDFLAIKQKTKKKKKKKKKSNNFFADLLLKDVLIKTFFFL